MKYLVIIPTYNERENIDKLITEVLKQDQWLEVLVVDDNSPDGTAKAVEDLQSERINLIKRSEKSGLGSAYRSGFEWALRRKYDFVISMDADFSHAPADLKRMIQLSNEHAQSIILGSRYIRGGKTENWGFIRALQSHIANLVTRLLLGTQAKDSTSGFKCYPISFLEAFNLKNLVASGYAFQVETLFIAKEKGFNIKEFPIIFVDRLRGESKMGKELKRSSLTVLKLALRRRVIRQFIKFGIIGFISTVIDWGLYFLIKLVTGADTQVLKQLIKAFSFVISATNSYILNRTWTFRSLDPKLARQAAKFFIVAVIGLGINNLIFFFATARLNLSDILGLILATMITLFWNFSANKIWVFKA